MAKHVSYPLAGGPDDGGTVELETPPLPDDVVQFEGNSGVMRHGRLHWPIWRYKWDADRQAFLYAGRAGFVPAD